MSYTTIHSDRHHFGWDNSLAPVMTVAAGAALELDVLDASGGRIGPESTAADIETLDPDFANPVTGPVAIEGAEPGDLLWVEILDLAPSGWGWTAIIPGFGLLADEFREPFLALSRYDAAAVELAPGVRMATRPFPGTIGVAPAAPGRHGAIPPRRVGGNLDMRHLVAGSRVGFPVEVAGALFSVGDTHAAQGDGEVCGTAVETPMRVAVRFELEKGAGTGGPRAELPAGAAATAAHVPVSVTMGVGPDLYEAARDAVRRMIDLVTARHGVSPELAYCALSVAGDLHLTEVVNTPSYVVSMYLPADIFG